MIETGAGITVLLSAILGVLVGGVVVTQTIYAATVDHIREYATLKAMGALYRLCPGDGYQSGDSSYESKQYYRHYYPLAINRGNFWADIAHVHWRLYGFHYKSHPSRSCYGV
jgi:hypothetical protein